MQNLKKLSILIPARNEEFLQKTVEDIFLHSELPDTEVLIALDNWENPPEIVENERLRVIKTNKGQRGATNELAKIAKGDYLMKCDAHVSFSQGFDRVLLETMEREKATVVVPALCNLYAYDWICDKGHKKPCEQFEKIEKCEQCGGDIKKDIVWQPIHRPVMTNYYFDTNLHFQYCEKQSEELVSETMSIQGSCFVISREDYYRLNICDEELGSWGQQGTEVSTKAWLSGGRVVSTREAFYAHWFRVFPYKNPTEDILKTQQKSKELFLNNKWPLQVKPIQWLIEKFNYQGDWTKEKVKELCKSK